MKRTTPQFALLLAAPLLLAAAHAHAQQFAITWSTIDCGGGAISGATPSGVSFSLLASIGQHDASAPATGTAPSGAAFALAGGFLAQGPAAPPPTCPADFNQDGNLDPDDLSDFITCFFTQVQFPGLCPASDFNGDGGIDPDDLSDFITAFFTGC